MRNAAACTWAASLLLALPAAAQTPAPATQPFRTSESVFQHGCRSLAEGDAVRAVELLTEAVARRPDAAEYALKLAEAQRAVGRADEAVRLLSAFRRQHGDVGEVGVGLARAMIDARRAADAVELLQPHEDRLDADGLLALVDALRAARKTARISAVLRKGLQRMPREESLWSAYIRAALAERQFASAAARAAEARREIGSHPEIQYLAAQAYFELGRFAGDTELRRFERGRAGQFVGEWLLLEAGPRPGEFTCCPRDSALYQIRAALDGGLNTPAAHLLHARVWGRIGRPGVGLAILKSREAALLDPPDPEVLKSLTELAMAANALDDYLRYVKLHAVRDPARGDEILLAGYRSLAERYNERGEAALYAAFLRRALELNPRDTEMRLALADVEWDLGRRVDAALLYRRVLEEAVFHPQRIRILARIEAVEQLNPGPSTSVPGGAQPASAPNAEISPTSASRSRP